MTAENSVAPAWRGSGLFSSSPVAQRFGRFQAQRRTGRSSGSTKNLNAARDARGPPDEAGAFEGEHHLMHAGWRDLEVPLHVGFRGRVAEVTAVGVDEGQVLTLLVGERGSRGHVPNN
jgi:hypothetical protein